MVVKQWGQRWLIDGQPWGQRRSTVVNASQSPSDRRSTTAGPPINGGQPPVNGGQPSSRFESLKFFQRQLFKSLEDWEVSSLQCMQRSTNNRVQHGLLEPSGSTPADHDVGYAHETSTPVNACPMVSVHHQTTVNGGQTGSVTSIDVQRRWDLGCPKHHAVIVYSGKIVRLPYNHEIMIIEGDRNIFRLSIISFIKTQKYMDKGCQVFLAHVMGKEVGKEAIGGCAHHSRFSRVVEVPQTLEYMGSQLNSAPILEVENFTNWKKRKPEGQWTTDERKAANLDQRLKSLIMSVLPDDQMNSVINCLTPKSTWDDLILYHEGPFDVKESRVMDLKLPKKWLCFCQSLKNTNHVKDSELASLIGKLKYEENLIDNIYETEKNKSLVFATPLSTAFISTSIVQDFQDSPDDEEDTRSSYEYLNDLEEEYQARALLAKSKRFFKKGTQRFSSAKATDQTECHKCGKKCHFARDCWSKAPVPSYQSPFQPKPLNSSQHKPELRPTKDFEAKYNKVKAKLALLSSSASASKAATVKNKGLIAEAYEWDEEEVSSDENEMVEVKVLMALAEENDVVSKEGARNGELVKTSMRRVHTLLEMEDNDDRKTYLDYLYEEEVSSDENEMVEVKVLMALAEENDAVSKEGARNGELVKTSMRRVHTLLEMKDNDDRKTYLDYLCIDLNYVEEQRNDLLSKPITETWLNSSNKVNQCISEQILSQKKRILGVDQLTEDPSSSRQKDLVFVKSSADDTKVSIPGVERPWLSEAEGFILLNHDTGRILLAESQRNTTDPFVVVTDSSATDYDSADESSVCSTPLPPLKKIISLEREIDPRNPQHAFKRCEVCGSSTHIITDHYDIEWFKIGEALQAKKVEALKSTRAESSNANRSKTLTKSGCSRHMTGVKSYLHKYVEQPRPKVVFRNDSTCTTEDKPCSSCENGKHHRASYKTKQTSSIKKCLHLLHMDLFGPLTPRSINHEKYTLVIVDKYSRYIWVYFLKKKSQAPETIMSFIKRVENQNDIKVKQLRTHNGTEFRNNILVNFYNEKGISQNFSSPYTPEQNGVAKRKNRTLIEAARTMLSGFVFSK
ncbi:retrovirus-related pol polyprotein from transposon TNT 1-94 [Tanacetum coccineum]